MDLCCKASLPFPGERTWDCGIIFDIFTHDLHTGLVKFYYNNIYTKDKKKEIQNDGLEDGYNVVVLKERQTPKKKTLYTSNLK